MICDSWLKVNDSAVLSELSLPGYKALYHCPQADRTGGRTALLSSDGIEVVKVLPVTKSSLEGSKWLVSTGATLFRVIVVYIDTQYPQASSSMSLWTTLNQFSCLVSHWSGGFNIYMDMSHNPDTIIILHVEELNWLTKRNKDCMTLLPQRIFPGNLCLSQKEC